MQERIVRWSYVAALAGLLALCPAAYAADVGVSVNVNVPGIYGQINIGELPAPELLLPRPVIAVPAPVAVSAPPPEPLYLHVPPGHEKHWARHCREYDACGRPVYFVSQRWYQDVYVPRHDWRRDERGHGSERGHEYERAHEHERAHEYERAERERAHEERAHEHERAHGQEFAHERQHGHEHERDGDSGR
jgi:hypothetical protein